MNLPVTAISGSLGLLSGVIGLSATALSFIGSHLLPTPWYNKIRGKRPSMKPLTKEKPLVVKASPSSHMCASLKHISILLIALQFDNVNSHNEVSGATLREARGASMLARVFLTALFKTRS